MSEKLKIVILGGGYAGLLTAASLLKKVHEKRVEITLVNKNDYHYLTTKIHESGAGTLDSRMILFPYSELINTGRINVIRDEVIGIDLAKKRVSLNKGTLNYDYLVVCIGGVPKTFNIPGLDENAFFLFDHKGTEKLCTHIENQFKKYLLDQDKSRLTFVIGGAGFTGIEFLYELIVRIPELREKYGVEKSKVKVICVEADNTLLKDYDPRMRDDVLKSMTQIDCTFKLGLAIASCQNGEVTFNDGSSIKANTMIWAGGVKGNPLLKDLGFELLDGRVKVNEFLEVPGYKDIYVLGDASVSYSPKEEPYQPSAQIALQQGQYCGYNIACKVYGQMARPFKYIHRGTVMSMGRKKATGVVYGKHVFGRLGAFMKYVIEKRYFLMLGGVTLLVKQFQREHKYKKRIKKEKEKGY
ncbi:NAD(P)/FAD-dependent oxidoreductase [Neobacillus sp. PS3-40]|uniref:NAD(P)/FAD-dependent oxidoreductase n=1 Tax=Neobacillus sp. PS3-40 TaxID=3070679 RepID=UPI0027E0D5C0|nr:NAD(P)/FAD-dependent oxidoreductase [Neobacillus sp. PS3-40]WML43215.1 NAD(P)/FAD-dependent oxidoreductase [Neobacillus sp. PS3-40]